MVDSSYGAVAAGGGGVYEGEMWLIRVTVCLLHLVMVVLSGEMWLTRVMVLLLAVVVVGMCGEMWLILLSFLLLLLPLLSVSSCF